MSKQKEFFERANRLLERLETLFPVESGTSIPETDAIAWRWQNNSRQSGLKAIQKVNDLHLSQLLCIDRPKQAIVENTRQFLANVPANNVLLWGPRGTGKSSLIKAILNEFSSSGLRLIEVEKDHLQDLPEIIDMVEDVDHHFIIYCDDLSFESNDRSYKTLKVVLDGSVRKVPDNVLIYATSNRRHLIPEYMKENENSSMQGGELHLNEAIEEKISLSERFGLWLSFHPFSQNEYLSIVDFWLSEMGEYRIAEEEVRIEALRWALEHGSRSGRSAWQFARQWTGKQSLMHERI